MSASEKDDVQWKVAAKNYASTRFSSLDEINRSNITTLKVSWTFSTGAHKGHEAAPLVVDETMYLTTPFPSILHAIRFLISFSRSGITR